ncbi:hypothetical protein [Nitrosopumilus ureiphilus]|uniref:Uncharacterized protein n=1 Tax=Nitrosopumilus ureiphilus TaxID=1470067 RepID=A0A7D5M6K0_9ARCH|nr:hypothetical protein [Nitrosopumilus ureiphilus]QLH06207.1 hypothetical protein C5F50_03270 [Nitrosopumilus ureiphilus]
MHKQTLKLVYADISSWIISGSLFSVLFIFMLYAREFLFFEPFFTFHLPMDWILSFVLIIIVSGLIALVTGLAVFQMRTIKANSRKAGTGVVGSIIGVGAGVCTSCGQIGFTIISTFGIAGATSLSFLTAYEIPIRLIAIAILSGTYFAMIKGITKGCKVNLNTVDENN